MLTAEGALHISHSYNVQAKTFGRPKSPGQINSSTHKRMPQVQTIGKNSTESIRANPQAIYQIKNTLHHHKKSSPTLSFPHSIPSNFFKESTQPIQKQ
jgi:hypothetical protein